MHTWREPRPSFGDVPTLGRKLERGCTGKTQYRSKALADRAAHQIGNLCREPFLSYQCPLCGLHHIAHDRRPR